MNRDDTAPADPPISGMELSQDPALTLKTDTLLSGVAASIKVKTRVVGRRGQPSENESDFELIDLVGQGGMGEVFSAQQVSMDRVVAVKLIKPEMQRHESARLLFLSEATITGKLDHPNIIPVHELGRTSDGVLFYAMKYARGTFWHRVIRQKSLAENLDILLRVADAIAYAHAHFIIHRDIKPQNILLGDFGEVLVMDWGVAMSVRPGATQIEVGAKDSRCGTPAYMAPEMAQGQRDQVSTASDIYLLGAVLYEIISGQPPHAGKDAGTALKNAERNKLAPLPRRKDELADIALKALQTQPADRYASVKEFQSALTAFREHQESMNLVESAAQRLATAAVTRDYGDFHEALFGYRQALRIWPGNAAAQAGLKDATEQYARAAVAQGDLELALTLLDENDEEQREISRDIQKRLQERTRHAARERALRRALAALGAAALAMFLLGAYWINRERLRAQRGEQRAEAALLESRRLLSKSLEAAAGEAISKDKNSEALALLAASLRQDASNLVAATRALDLLNRLNWALPQFDRARYRNPELVSIPAMPPDPFPKQTVRLDYVDDRNVLLRIADAKGTPLAEPAIGPLESRRTAPATATISPDGRYVAFSSGARFLHLFDRFTGKAVRPAERHTPCSQNTFCFSPDARSLLTAGGLGVISFSAVEVPGTVRQDFHIGPGLTAAAFASDHTRLAVAMEGLKGARFVDLRPGQARPRIFDMGAWINEGGISPDGRRISLTTRMDETRVFSLATGETEGAPIEHGDSIWALAYSPDGRLLALGSRRGELVLWNLHEAREIGRIPPSGSAITHLVFDPAGRSLYSAGEDRQVRRWEPSTLSENGVLKTPRNIKGLAISPDGKKLLVGCVAMAALYSTEAFEADKPLMEVTLGGGWMRAVDFSPDGALAVVAGYRKVAVLQLEKLQVISTVEGHPDSVWRAKFNPDSTSFATVSHNGNLRLWSRDGEPLSPLLTIGREDIGGSDTLAYSPDGRWVAAGAGDGTVRIWDAHTGREVMGPLVCGDRQITVVDFSPDGRHLLVSSTDGRAWLLALAPIEATPSWLPDLAEAAGGLRVQDSVYSIVPWPERRDSLVKALQESEALPNPDTSGAWRRWFLADRGERTVSPWSTVSIREEVDCLLQSGKPEDVEAALDMAPDNSACYRRLAETVRPADARRADFYEALARQLEPTQE